MTITNADALPEATGSTVRAMVEVFAARHQPRAVALRARATQGWTGTTQEGIPVTVVPAPSALAVREALRAHRQGEWTVIVTDRDADDLGAGILSRLMSAKVFRIDPWESVQELFKATRSAASFISMNRSRDIAFGLIRTMPPRGWPPAPGGVLTREHALDSLIEARLGITASERDLRGLVRWSLRPDATNRLRGLVQDAGDALAEAVLDRLAESAGAARDAARPLLSTDRLADLAPLGVVVDLLTREDLAAEQRRQADISLARGERWWHEQLRSSDPALRVFGATIGLVVDEMAMEAPRAADQDTPTPAWSIADRADVLLSEVDALHLAGHSDLVPSGYRLRIDELGRALSALNLTSGSPGADRIRAVETAWVAVSRHRLVARYRGEYDALHAAVRLGRWLNVETHEGNIRRDPGATLASMVRAQLDDAAWADAAINTAAVGVSPDLPARGIEHVITAAMARREVQARDFAKVLVRATAEDVGALDGVVGDPTAGVVLIERVLDRIIAPLIGENRRILLVVLDGLSASVGTVVAADAVRRGWEEVSLVGDRRMAAVAVLPTITETSRASLLAGELTRGGRDDETAAFKRYVDERLKRRGHLFHKGALEASRDGYALSESVRDAVDDVQETDIVAVVLNTIDDALDRSDPGGTTWTADAVKHLEPLLARAHAVGRTVVITGDHGHIVERRLGHTRSHRGADSSGRSHSADADTVVDPSEEVLIEGRRVLLPGHRAVLSVSDRLRYGPIKAGYHGGAHPAEVVVPVLVFQPAGGDEANGLPPQDPAWWLGPLAAPAETSPAAVRSDAPRTGRPRKRAEHPKEQVALFDVAKASEPPRTPTAAPISIGHRVVASEVYKAQLALGPRLRITGDQVARLVDALLAAPGHRLEQVPAAQALGVPVGRLPGAQEQVKQLLNVDGYAVLRVDADGTTLVLDAAALRDQFGVAGG